MAKFRLKALVFTLFLPLSMQTMAYSPLPLISPSWYAAKYNSYKLLDAPLTKVRVLEVLNANSVKVENENNKKQYLVKLFYVHVTGNSFEQINQLSFLRSMVNHEFLLRSVLDDNEVYGIFHQMNGNNLNLTAILNGLYELNEATSSSIYNEKGFLTLYKFTKDNKEGIWGNRK